MHRAPSTGLRVRFQHQVSTQLLGAAVPGSDADVAQALVKITEDEQKQRLAEAEFKRHQASTNNEHWPVRSVSAYGGTHEGEDVYLIAEVKSAAHDCHDFRAATRRPRDPRSDVGDSEVEVYCGRSCAARRSAGQRECGWSSPTSTPVSSPRWAGSSKELGTRLHGPIVGH